MLGDVAAHCGVYHCDVNIASCWCLGSNNTVPKSSRAYASYSHKREHVVGATSGCRWTLGCVIADGDDGRTVL